MSSLLLPLAKGFGLGGSLIVAIGAQNAFVLRQGLKHRHVFAVATVCALCDMALIALGCAGFGSIVAAFPALTSIAAWGGAAFLFWYGLRAFRSAMRPGALAAGADDKPQTLRAAVLTALALSLLNPHVYLDTVVLIGSIAGQFDGTDRLAFAIGAMTASIVWFYGVGYGAGRLAPLFARPAAWRVLDTIIGVVMWSIAAGLVRGELATLAG